MPTRRRRERSNSAIETAKAGMHSATGEPGIEGQQKKRVNRATKKRERMGLYDSWTKQHATPKSEADADSALTIIEKLPTMAPHQLQRIWKNAVRKKAERNASRAWKSAATSVLDAVEGEWRKRELHASSSNDYFVWPSTDAEGGGNQSLSFEGKRREGMLSYLEYHVGKTNGEAEPVRRAILDRVFSAFLPPVFPRDYMDEWASPNSASRLRKMAESLAAFTRNAKRSDPDLNDEAISDWEDDLEYLYERYYVGRFNFGWPSTNPV